MDADVHRQRIERAFTDQAAAFEDRRFNRVFTADAAWAFEHLPRGRDDLALDVAAGTGHAARQLAVADLVAEADPAVATVRTSWSACAIPRTSPAGRRRALVRPDVRRVFS